MIFLMILFPPPGKYSHDYWQFRIIRSLFADYQEHSLIIEHTVLLHKTRASYVSWFNFGGRFCPNQGYPT